MLFSDVLDIHKSYAHPQGLGDILGDSFLLESNPIYRKVRQVSLEIGCRYVEAYPEYLLLPFYELPKIVANKCVPYVPHARLMEGIERGRPDTFSTEDVPMPESYHLHESAHVIAEHFYKDVSLRTPQEKILKAILCESFANAVDAMACMPATDDIHRFFIKQNCYMHPRLKVMRAMTDLAETMGLRFTFMLAFFTYVQANFLAKALGMKAIRQLAERYALDPQIDMKRLKNIRIVRAIGENLDPRFRVTTTGNFLKQEGFEGEVYDILSFPFHAVFKANMGLAKATEALSLTLSER
ncbi:MAG: hypothetical protein KF799_09540 [Bdellovibrionales bacterium]|nr:hypothetical protein [Bdellovibrionales bacterium]